MGPNTCRDPYDEVSYTLNSGVLGLSELRTRHAHCGGKFVFARLLGEWGVPVDPEEM